MNSKYKFGLTEVIATIVGSLLIVGIDILFNNYEIVYANACKSFLIVIVAAVFGAASGVVAAVASSLLQAAILGLDISLISVIALALLAYAVGHYAPRYGIRDGLFKGKAVLRFVLVKLLAEVISWLFFLPLFNFLMTRENLLKMLDDNIMRVLMLTLSDIVIIPIFLIISRFSTGNVINKKDNK